MLFDTHAHLTDDRFRDDLPAVLQRAAAAGVVGIVAIGTTARDSAECVALAEQHDLVRAAVGIQPNCVAAAQPGDWDAVRELAQRPVVVAIGETGLDRHWHDTPFDQQLDYFARHLELSRRLNKPVVIHSRDCAADMVRALREEFDRRGPIRGVMHSFTGSHAMADACLEMGLHLSFAGMATYKNAGDLRAIARSTPVDRILIETDAPYLAPEPVRGRRNEPAFVAHTVARLAAERGESAHAFAVATTSNARRLFRLTGDAAESRR